MSHTSFTIVQHAARSVSAQHEAATAHYNGSSSSRPYRSSRTRWLDAKAVLTNVMRFIGQHGTCMLRSQAGHAHWIQGSSCQVLHCWGVFEECSTHCLVCDQGDCESHRVMTRLRL
eukprot:GHRR01016878.1.p2 GENE.GHRR01016878.1~~GHRR01016878.1.p2  ORF type:complete len:116 (+),score=25.95 GHRR01016878.1:599-946(+)